MPRNPLHDQLDARNKEINIKKLYLKRNTKGTQIQYTKYTQVQFP